jgi:hypothetical protein
MLCIAHERVDGAYALHRATLTTDLDGGSVGKGLPQKAPGKNVGDHRSRAERERHAYRHSDAFHDCRDNRHHHLGFDP